MRIGLLTDIYLPWTNGVANHVAMLKHCLEAMGEQVWLFVPGRRDEPDREPNVIRIPGIPIADTGYHLSLVLDRRSRQLLREMDVVHVHHPFVSGSFGLYCSTQYGVPMVFTNHTRYDIYVKQYLRMLPTAVSEGALQTFFESFSRRCAALVAPSESIGAMMANWGAHGKIEVIPNGVDLARFAVKPTGLDRAALGLPADAVVALYVGRMSGEKSIGRLLTIFSQVAVEAPTLHLLLVGGGPELDDLRALADSLRLGSRVRFTGAVPYADVPAYMALADFFVSASVSEVHPLTFIDAAAAGLPALGFRSPGIADIVVDGQTGLLAEESDLSLGLRFLRLAQDPALRAELAGRAAASVEGLSAETNARRLHALYTAVIEG